MPVSKKPIYDEQTKTYSLKTGRIEAVIGDEKVSDEFYPRLKLKVWDNECNVSVGLITDKATRDRAIIEQKDDTVSWQKGNVEAKFYPLDATEQHKEGGYEFEVVLHEPPESNVLEFSLNIPKELKFYCQPELTQKEKDEGAEQPENVIGSYAVYHASKGNMHKGREEAEKYKAGKAFHIYRPKIIDANGDWVWGELKIDEEKLILSITIDEDWLRKAVYPVRIDPTFGYTSVGGNKFTSNFPGATKVFSPQQQGRITSMSVYVQSGSAPTNVAVAIYSDVNNNTVNLLSEGSEIASVSAYITQWVTVPISYSFDPDTAYRLAYWFSSTGFPYYYYDSGVYKDLQENRSVTFSNWPNPFNSEYDFSRKVSIYATYEEAASDPTVTTSPATSVDHESATLNGSLTDLGSETSVDVYFEYRKSGASTWSSTTAQAKTAIGTFSADISSLDASTEYEFRAVVEWDSGAETAYGGVAYFETEAGTEYCEYVADLIRTIIQTQSYNADTLREIIEPPIPIPTLSVQQIDGIHRLTWEVE